MVEWKLRFEVEENTGYLFERQMSSCSVVDFERKQ